MNYTLSLLFAISNLTLFAQEVKIVQLDTLYPVPGFKAPAAETDLSASVRYEILRDSILIEVSVLDDSVQDEPGNADRVDVWFASPDVDFSDYISGKHKGRTYLFRNSDQAGDQADLKRFLSNGDYPTKTLETAEGKPADMLVPLVSSLNREVVFAGITHYICFAGSKEVQRADLDKYQAFEAQTGLKVNPPAEMIKKKYERTAKGYKMSLRMPVEALGFMRMHGMDKLVTAIEIIDSDSGSDEKVRLSTARYLYYGRPWYFNKIELPFELKPTYPESEYALIAELGLIQEMVYTPSGWKLYGLSKNPIVYAKDYISEASLMQYLFFPVKTTYSRSDLRDKGSWQRLDIQYDDITVFKQNEVYFRVLGQTLSGKMPGYATLRKDAFVNKVIFITADTALVSMYDYEPNDPLGFGEFGLTADEYYSIQQVTPGSVTTVFSSGERIRAASTINLGEQEGIVKENVQKTEYKWIKEGELFEVKIFFHDSKKPEFIVFKRQASGQFRRIN